MTSISATPNHVQENYPPNSPTFANLPIAESAPTGLRAGLSLQDAQDAADEMDEGQEYQEQQDGQDAGEGLQDAQGDQVTWHRYKQEGRHE